MSEEHQRIVCDEVTRYDGWLEADPLPRKGRLSLVGRLTEIFLDFTFDASTGIIFALYAKIPFFTNSLKAMPR